jgi:ribosomal protein S18 acetylase RimI-like enzyme
LDSDILVRPYIIDDREAVIALWQECGLVRPWNNPELDIIRKLKVQPELFLVGFSGDKLVATAMAGYDGHRGWVSYLAVAPSYQNKSIGRQIMEAVERKLLAMGCPKINLQIRSDNKDIVKFYEAIGYKIEDRISMGKRITED